MRVRLANPGGMFYDNETKFRISKKEIKEVGKIGDLTRQWMNGGGLVICEDEEIIPDPVVQKAIEGEPVTIQPEPEVEPEQEVEVKTPKPVGRPPYDAILIADTHDEAKELFSNNSRASLIAMAKERKIRFAKNISTSTLAKNIVAYDKEHKND